MPFSRTLCEGVTIRSSNRELIQEMQTVQAQGPDEHNFDEIMRPLEACWKFGLKGLRPQALVLLGPRDDITGCWGFHICVPLSIQPP